MRFMDYFAIYTKKNCPWCDKAKDLIVANGRRFIELDVGEHPEWMPVEYKTVPQIWDGGVHIGGYEDLVTHFELIKFLAES